VHRTPSPPEIASDQLTVQVDLVTATIAVSGDLDRDGVHLFIDATTTLAATLHRSWVLDASCITFCDAGGLRAIAAAAQAAQRRGGGLTVVGAGRSLRRLLVLVGLADLLRAGTGPDRRADGPTGSASLADSATPTHRTTGGQQAVPTFRGHAAAGRPRDAGWTTPPVGPSDGASPRGSNGGTGH
jgi:anti-anti-sigma factor